MSRVIVFQGDSITDVGRSRDEATPANQGMGSGYPFLVSSYLRCHEPKRDWQIFNRGISGNRVVDLYARWKIDALNLKPDILSILIGVNDTWHEFARGNGVEVPRYEKIYRMLLEWTFEVLPDVRLVLLEPYVQRSEIVLDSWVKEMDQRRAIVKALAKEFGAIFIPTQSLLDAALKKAPSKYWLHDGVHPTSAGHQLIAEAWIKATKDIR
ncbi:MAG: SGNH/GDSL hydrolase family protein [Lentisphaeria bacterium]|nr:SGNH/GDSL hydrolase family protein [Lentisphaeria bacterium]